MEKSAMSVNVCVIGTGLCGLGAIKSCLEDGLKVEAFERLDNLGGLWRYREERLENVAGVTKNTIIDSSKDLSFYTDFTPKLDVPNFMHNSHVTEYMEDYARHFRLLPHIRFEHEVLKVEPNDDYQQTGRWKVRVQNKKTGHTEVKIFDAVMICAGHHSHPNWPDFPFMDQFKGELMHTQSYKTHEGFEKKRIAVVGVGNSAMDAACELSRVSGQVYLSTRRGVWVMSRVGQYGVPYDFAGTQRFQNFVLTRILPWSWANSFYENQISERMDHELYGLKPKHRFFEQHPSVGDELPNAILAGRVTVKGNIERFTKKGVYFANDANETELDVVIFATGYTMNMPFLDPSIVDIRSNQAELYGRVFPPHLKHPTLAIIGFIQPHGGLCPAAEMQSRWAVRVFAGKMRLPDERCMRKEIANHKKEQAKYFVQTARHTVDCNYVDYMDEVAERIGAKPNLWKLALTDPRLFYACLFGPCVPYQYRLKGPHAWKGARHAILTVEERMKAPLAVMKNMKSDKTQRCGNKKWDKKRLGLLTGIVIAHVVAVGVYYNVFEGRCNMIEKIGPYCRLR